MNFYDNPPSWLDLESIVPIVRTKRRNRRNTSEERRSAEEITGLSADTIKREYSQYVIELSKRRLGMKLRFALKIAAGEVTRV